MTLSLKLDKSNFVFIIPYPAYPVKGFLKVNINLKKRSPDYDGEKKKGEAALSASPMAYFYIYFNESVDQFRKLIHQLIK